MFSTKSVMVNLINIVFSIFSMLTIIYITTESFQEKALEQDDDYLASLSQYYDDHKANLLLGMAIAVMMYMIGVFGALRYSVLLVFVCGIFYCILLTINMFTWGIISGIWNILCAYPHWVLVVELQRGIISPVTYPMEQQSCCCV